MKIGMTTSIPVEAVFAAGCVPVDLNNVFINAPDPSKLVAEAEYAGYPRNACGWIKGIYSVAASGEVDAVVAVVEGDCSQTQAMVETLEERGVEIIPFSFPYGRDRDVLRLQIQKLIERLGTTWNDSLAWKQRLDEIRRKVRRLDELTWQAGTISSFENHYYQVCCSDFNRDPDAFEREVDERLARAEGAEPSQGGLRLGYIGVPSIYSDFYDVIESMGARVVYNEVQRQFAMPLDTDRSGGAIRALHLPLRRFRADRGHQARDRAPIHPRPDPLHPKLLLPADPGLDHPQAHQHPDPHHRRRHPNAPRRPHSRSSRELCGDAGVDISFLKIAR